MIIPAPARKVKRARMRELGVDPYGGRYPDARAVTEVLRYAEGLDLAPEHPAHAGVVAELEINGRKAGEAAYPFSLFWNLRPGSFTIKATAVRKGERMESAPVRIIILS